MNAHFQSLDKSYRDVGDMTWATEDFVEEKLEISRSLFVDQSLADGDPRPKQLEVYALVSGLSFEPNFMQNLVEARDEVDEIIGDALTYWVKPENLGVEYCVFKWPTDDWDDNNLPIVKDATANISAPAFEFTIKGIQINPDGCVVAKGFDQPSSIFKVREELKKNISFLPKRQSGWAHVPLGRILEPIGVNKFARLREKMKEMSNREIAQTRIDVMRLVHETRWYMEEKTVIKEISLDSHVGGATR
ncbi:hypothetical protein [Thalassospira indica]|uniref:Uncharacterized protein n=1 Tax=Thalassospira indica TaxID=1891279 RepID=A0ABM6XWQ3_9PROT|nr:hypothetical protein [Thalassospira indica]AXO13649.1 hypothetical protein DY252_05000 [Thalassospira indica]OAZ14470.1 hypothetical protein TH15_01240 [Thalassospira profundimaris]